MNDIELYDYLASNNSRFGRPLRKDEVNTSIPYFEIFRNNIGKYDIKGYNYESHDNASRMLLLEYYLKTNIFPNIKNNVCGYYNIELHDSYTYLNNNKNYKGCLVFSKFKDDNTPVLIPDPYSMCNWNGLQQRIPNDNIPWNNKLKKACFYGTTTGSRITSLNERINMCLWSVPKRDILDCYITKIAQMTENDVQMYAKDLFPMIISQPKDIDEQMKYKFNIVIDGNTCRFDIWNYFMNSVALKFESKEHLWYYPMLQDNIHFKSVRKDNIESIIMNTDDKEANFIINNAKCTMKKIVNPLTSMQYFTSLFEYMYENGA